MVHAAKETDEKTIRQYSLMDNRMFAFYLL